MTNPMTIKLAHGKHGPNDRKGCYVEVGGLVTTGEWTGDNPEHLFCPALMGFGRRFNDWMTDSERHVLLPFTVRLAGTAEDGLTELRMFRFADWAVREIAPLALDARGRHEDAAKLRALDPVVDKQTARAAAAAADAAAAANAATRADIITRCIALMDELWPKAPLPEDAMRWDAVERYLDAGVIGCGIEAGHV